MRRIQKGLCSTILILLQLFIFSNASHAITTVCGAFASGSTPYVYTDSYYTGSEALIYNSIRINASSLPLHPSAWATFPTASGGGFSGLQAPVTLGSHTIEGEGILGNVILDAWEPSTTRDSCSTVAFFTLPFNLYVNFSPSNVVTLGNSVTVSWGSEGALGCQFVSPTESDIVPVTGSITFTPILADSGTYTLSCWNQFGWTHRTNNLTVEEPVSCPSIPTGASSMSYIGLLGNSVETGQIGNYKKVGNLAVTSEAYCDGSVWRLKLTSATLTDRINVDLSNLGNTQITSGMISAANCTALNTMKNDLISKSNSVTATFGGYYDEAAVIAHEEVHRGRTRFDHNALFTSYKTAIESFTIPLSTASNQSTARSILQGSAYNLELANFNSESTLAFSFNASHLVSTDFINAQVDAVQHWITDINARLALCP